MLEKHLIYITGLPRSGSTLLCQLLAHHPQIYSPGKSSPLCQAIVQLRYYLSDTEFLLSQLDENVQFAHQRLINAFRGFINGWFAETDKTWVVDKHRGWLNQLDTVILLDPPCRMLVCVRELGQIYGSIETQHQKTLLLDFPDHLANLSRFDRADKLFAHDGVVGAPLRAIESLQDLPETLQKRLYFVVFEDLIDSPQQVMSGIYTWLGLPETPFDPQNLQIQNGESDSHYRCKYPHTTHASIQPPSPHLISPRIQRELQQNFPWYYQTFYPGFNQPRTVN